MQWTERIRQVKILLVIAAILIAVVSLLVSHYLVRDLSNEERHKMEVWAQALRALNNAGENTDVSLVLSVMRGNNTIPVIVIDSLGTVTDYRNISIDGKNKTDSDSYLSDYGRRLWQEGKYIKIFLGDSTKTSDYQLVCYDAGQNFTAFSPAISKKSMMKIKTEIRGWNLNHQTQLSITQIAEKFNPEIRGWLNYYLRFGKSEFRKVMSYLNERLQRWVKRKYKRFRTKLGKAYDWLVECAAYNRRMFSHWACGYIPYPRRYKLT